MGSISCPRCGCIQKEEPSKTWKWSSSQVERYLWECGKPFNLYIGEKRIWTIPKDQNERDDSS